MDKKFEKLKAYIDYNKSHSFGLMAILAACIIFIYSGIRDSNYGRGYWLIVGFSILILYLFLHFNTKYNKRHNELIDYLN